MISMLKTIWNRNIMYYQQDHHKYHHRVNIHHYLLSTQIFDLSFTKIPITIDEDGGVFL